MTRFWHKIAPALALALAIGLTAGGCRPDFAPYNRLTGLRVLAIKSSNPDPAYMDKAAVLSALVYVPPGFPAPTYAWSWCPFPGPAGQGHPCLVTEQDIATMFPAQAAQIPPFDLGTDPTANLANTVDSSVLTQLCAGVGGPLITSCDNGFPFQIALTVRTDGADPSQTQRVDAVVTGHWRLDPTTPANNNPSIGLLTAAPRGVAPEQLMELAATTATPLPRDLATTLHADVRPEAAEMYAGLDDNRNPAQLRERLFLTWFVETGDTDNSRTSFIATPTDPVEDQRRLDALQKNTWSPALKKDYAPDTAHLYVVIHDNRGGVDWISGSVNLEPTP